MKLGMHITYGYTVTDKYFQNFRSKVKVVGRRKERMVVEIRDWCQNVGEYNTYNFCIWHFGLCVIVSKIDRCRSSDPPYEIAINPIFRSYRVSDVIIQSFLNRSRCNLVHTLVARRARSAISVALLYLQSSPLYLSILYWYPSPAILTIISILYWQSSPFYILNHLHFISQFYIGIHLQLY